MRIIGIDPGLRMTGYGCVEVTGVTSAPTLVEAGVLRLDARCSVASRLAELHADLSDLLVRLKPTHACVEKLYAHYAHPTTAIKMGHARGVILLALEQAGCQISEYSATRIKKAITGHGHAGKKQVQLSVQAQCGLAEPPSPIDVSDAIAIALTAAHRLTMQVTPTAGGA